MNQKGLSVVFLIIILFILSVGGFISFNTTMGSKLINKIPSLQRDKIFNNFDVSKDKQLIIFPFGDENKNSIYISKIDGTGIRKVQNTEAGNFPKFSNDGKKILYLSDPNPEGQPRGFRSINISGVDGLDVKKVDIFEKNLNIKAVSEAIFSLDGEKIYFIGRSERILKNAEQYDREMKAFIENDKTRYHIPTPPRSITPMEFFDIYSLNMSDLKITKITAQDYNKMSSLSLDNSGGVLFANVSNLYSEIKTKNTNMVAAFSDKDFSKPEFIDLDPYVSESGLGGFKGTEFSLTDDGLGIVYNTGDWDNPSYDYFHDLYYARLEGGKWQPAKKITNIHKSSANPKIIDDKVFFISVEDWGGKYADPNDFHLMEVKLDGKDLKEIKLQIPH